MARKKISEDENQAPALSRSDQIAATLRDINVRLNVGVKQNEWQSYLHPAYETTSPFFLRRSTNILGLDLAIGGGFPAGGITQVASPDAIGKNALSLQVIAQCQQVYGEEAAIAWVPLEFPFDKPFAHRMGVAVPMSESEINLENMARHARNLPELIPDELDIRRRSRGTFIIIDRGPTAKRFEAVVELVRSNLFQIVVIDSVAAILTEQRDSTPLDQFSQQSSEAFLLTEFQRKLWGVYCPDEKGEPNWTTLIAINQVRGNRHQMGPFSRKWTVGGAYALKHGKLLDIWLSRGEVVTMKKPDDTGKMVTTKVGKVVKWEIAKGKAGCHEGPQGSLEYHWDTGFQVDQDLVDTALSIGTIVRTGNAAYSLINQEGVVLEDFRGKATLYERATDPEWFAQVYQLSLQRAGISCIYKL